MTPAVRAAEAAGVRFHLHRYEHDPRAHSYGLEAAQRLGQDPARVFKTLVAGLPQGRFVVAVVPVARELDLKALAAACGAKKAALAAADEAERVTGYVTGGISPLGQKRALTTVIDVSADAFETVFVSAGRRGLEIELAPADLADVTGGCYAAIA